MNLALFAIDVWLLVLAVALLLWSQAVPNLVRSSRHLAPEARARRLLGYALAPWAIAWLTVALAFAPTWLAATGWVTDWCLSRNAGSLAACPMHGFAADPAPAAPLLAMLALLLSAVALMRAGWMVHLAISIARRLGMVKQRSMIVDGLRVDVVAGNQALAMALCVPNCRVVVSEEVVERLEAAEFRALIEHERAHLARGDAYATLVLGIATMLLLPRARTELRCAWRLAVEQSCDSIAAYRTNALTLASALLKYARLHTTRQPQGAMLSAFDEADLGCRIRSLLHPEISVALPSTRLRWWLCASLPLAFTLHELGEFLLLPLVV
ncbi:MAG TPA: M48 family metalloprotease [Xanthomonadales bacterium]|nr:M48 family metalloprotease [Xanthomonadales bacterium]